MFIFTAGVADAIAQGLPGVIGQSKDTVNGGELISASSIDEAGNISVCFFKIIIPILFLGVRRQPTAAQRAISGLAAALGGGGSNSPTHAGLPSEWLCTQDPIRHSYFF